MSDRYISGRCLPDKAIDVIDESGARVRLKAMTKPPNLKELDGQIEQLNQEKEQAVAEQDFEKAAQFRDKADKIKRDKERITREWSDKSKESGGVVDEEVIREVVGKMTGVPLTRINSDETARLLTMEDDLHKSVISQHEAIVAIAKAVRKSRSGLKDPKRPIGSFIFAGPTGVGKTLLAKQLAKFMFGDENALVQIDMSEYSEKHNVSRLIGAPPGYIGYEEGGQLTEKIRRRPYSVVLLDEIEKAHPEVWNMLLQIMEEGRLTDNVGRTVDFKNTILIMTTNIGAESIAGRREFGIHAGARRNEESTYENMKALLKGEMEKNFRPEFLNRVDDVIVFRSLTKPDLKHIIDIELSKVTKRLKEKNLTLVMSDDAKEFLIEKGTSLEYGARPLRRAIEQYLEDPLAEDLLRGTFVGKDTITVRATGEKEERKLVFDTTGPAPVLVAAGESTAIKGGVIGIVPASGAASARRGTFHGGLTPRRSPFLSPLSVSDAQRLEFVRLQGVVLVQYAGDVLRRAVPRIRRVRAGQAPAQVLAAAPAVIFAVGLENQPVRVEFHRLAPDHHIAVGVHHAELIHHRRGPSEPERRFIAALALIVNGGLPVAVVVPDRRQPHGRQHVVAVLRQGRLGGDAGEHVLGQHVAVVRTRTVPVREAGESVDARQVAALGQQVVALLRARDEQGLDGHAHVQLAAGRAARRAARQARNRRAGAGERRSARNSAGRRAGKRAPAPRAGKRAPPGPAAPGPVVRVGVRAVSVRLRI